MNNVLDELFEILPPGWRVVYSCYGCKHFNPRTFTCPAFPKGIPSDIIEGFMPHTTVFRNQVGEYVFEPKPDFKPKIFRSSNDLTRRFLRPKEDIIKWITYKGRRIPIFKKSPPTETYKALSHLLIGVRRGVFEASLQAVKRFSKFLEEKNAKWMTVDDPIWKRHVSRVETYYSLHNVKAYKTNGKMYLPQIVRIDRTLRKLEKRFPGILSDVHMVCVPSGKTPQTRAFVVIDKAHLEGGRLCRGHKGHKFLDSYFSKILKHIGVKEKYLTYRQLRSVRWIPETHPNDLLLAYQFTAHFGAEPTIVAFVSSGYANACYPSTDHIVHEFGHILHNKRDKLRKFMLDVYAPYLGRCIKGGFGKFPAQSMSGRAKLPHLVSLYQKDDAFRNAVFTPYSLINPFEGYAEAFRGYINHPQVLKQKWPEAYDFFRKIEEQGLS